MNKINPLVSFIIATYNRADYVCDAVRSILKQRYNCIEIIVIDDCSEDNTYEALVNNFQDKVIYRRNPKNSGPAFSRNIGLGLAKGKYIGLLDSDDLLYDERHTEIAVDLMEKDEEIAIFCCDFYDIDKESNVLNKHSPFPNIIDYIGFSISSGKQRLSDYYLRGLSCAGALLRGSAARIVGPMDVRYRIGWDAEYFLRILGKSQSCLYYYHRPLACVRRHPGSTSNNLVKAYIEKLKIHEQIARDYPILKKELGWKLNKRIAIILICLSDAYKLEKRYDKAIFTIIKSLAKYPPLMVFYYFCFLSIFHKKYNSIKLTFLKV